MNMDIVLQQFRELGRLLEMHTGVSKPIREIRLEPKAWDAMFRELEYGVVVDQRRYPTELRMMPGATKVAYTPNAETIVVQSLRYFELFGVRIVCAET